MCVELTCVCAHYAVKYKFNSLARAEVIMIRTLSIPLVVVAVEQSIIEYQ